MAAQTAETIFTANDAQIKKTWADLFRNYTNLSRAVASARGLAGTAAKSAIDGVKSWAKETFSLRNIYQSLTAAIMKAQQVNRAFLREQATATVRRDVATTTYLQQAGVRRSDPAARAAQSFISQQTEKYGATYAQTAGAATELVSQGFAVKDVMAPGGALEQIMRYSTATGVVQEGGQLREIVKSVAMFMKASGREKTGEEVYRYSKNFLTLFKTTPLQAPDMTRFAEDVGAIRSATGMSQEALMAWASTIVETQKISKGSTGLTNLANILSAVQTSKGKIGALETIGLTPRDVDMSTAETNLTAETIMAATGMGPDDLPKIRAAMEDRLFVATAQFRVAQHRMRKTHGVEEGDRVFKLAVSKIFGMGISKTSALTAFENVTSFPSRLRELQGPEAAQYFAQTVRTGGESLGAGAARAEERSQRSLQSKSAATAQRVMRDVVTQARRMTKGAPGAEPAIQQMSENMQNMLASVFATGTFQEKLAAAASGELPWENLMGSFFSGDVWTNLNIKANYSGTFQKALQRAIELNQQDIGGLSEGVQRAMGEISVADPLGHIPLGTARQTVSSHTVDTALRGVEGLENLRKGDIWDLLPQDYRRRVTSGQVTQEKIDEGQRYVAQLKGILHSFGPQGLKGYEPSVAAELEAAAALGQSPNLRPLVAALRLQKERLPPDLDTTAEVDKYLGHLLTDFTGERWLTAKDDLGVLGRGFPLAALSKMVIDDEGTTFGDLMDPTGPMLGKSPAEYKQAVRAAIGQIKVMASGSFVVRSRRTKAMEELKKFNAERKAAKEAALKKAAAAAEEDGKTSYLMPNGRLRQNRALPIEAVTPEDRMLAAIEGINDTLSRPQTIRLDVGGPQTAPRKQVEALSAVG